MTLIRLLVPSITPLDRVVCNTFYLLYSRTSITLPVSASRNKKDILPLDFLTDLNSSKQRCLERKFFLMINSL